MALKVQLGGTGRSLEDVEALHALGLEFAEIPITRPDRFEARMAAFAEVREKTGMFYLCHGPREGDPNDIQALRSVYVPRVERVLSLMPDLGVTLLTMHLWLDPRFVRPEVIQSKIQILDELIQKADAWDVHLCLENLSENHEHLSEAFHILPALGLTLDLGHGQLLTRENTSFGFIRNYPDRILHIHLHDNRGGSSPADDLHLPVGEGTIGFRPIFRELERMGYERTITLELRPHEISRCLDRVKELLQENADDPKFRGD